jgi:hypothetical protein
MIMEETQIARVLLAYSAELFTGKECSLTILLIYWLDLIKMEMELPMVMMQ